MKKFKIAGVLLVALLMFSFGLNVHNAHAYTAQNGDDCSDYTGRLGEPGDVMPSAQDMGHTGGYIAGSEAYNGFYYITFCYNPNSDTSRDSESDMSLDSSQTTAPQSMGNVGGGGGGGTQDAPAAAAPKNKCLNDLIAQVNQKRADMATGQKGSPAPICPITGVAGSDSEDDNVDGISESETLFFQNSSGVGTTMLPTSCVPGSTGFNTSPSAKVSYRVNCVSNPKSGCSLDSCAIIQSLDDGNGNLTQSKANEFSCLDVSGDALPREVNGVLDKEGRQVESVSDKLDAQGNLCQTLTGLQPWKTGDPVPPSPLTIIMFPKKANTGASMVASQQSVAVQTAAAKFAIGDKVKTTAAVKVRSAAVKGVIENQIGPSQPLGATGTVVADGPFATLNGVPHIWWNIDFGNGTDGWVVEDYLVKATGNIGSVTKVTTTANSTVADLPSVPANFQATTQTTQGQAGSACSANFSWSPVEGAVTYVIKDSDTDVITINATSTPSYSYSFSTPGEHFFTVQAFNTIGVSPKSNEVYLVVSANGACQPVSGLPNAPTNFTATTSPLPSGYGYSANFSWSPVEGAVTYVIKDSDTDVITINATSTPSYSYSFSTPGEHFFTVQAFNTIGVSPKSNEVYLYVSNIGSGPISTTFSKGDRVQTTTSGVNARLAPGGVILPSPTRAIGTTGTITDPDSEDAMLNGQNYHWWYVTFDDDTYGWVAEDYLVKASTITPGAPDYSLSNGGDVTITKNTTGSATGTNTITATAVSGTQVPVSFQMAGLPTGVTVSSNPTGACTPITISPCVKSLSYTIASSVVAGNYPITITASGTGAPTKTTTFQLNVLAASGGTSNFPVVTLIATPPSVAAGKSTILTISGTNSPTGCTIDGTSVPGTGGTKTLSPTISTTYLGTCTNANGIGTKGVTVSVNPIDQNPGVPVVTLSPSQTSINFGQSVTITLSATNSPTSCAVNGTNFGTGGTSTFFPSVTTTFKGTCINANGIGTNSVTVNVGPINPNSTAPTVSLTATPTSITSGGSSTLSWTSTNATACTGTDFAAGISLNGTKVVSPTANATYSITCVNSAGTMSAPSTTTVNVGTINQNPTTPTVNLTASPTSITSGQSSTLSWTSTNATSCSSSQFTTSNLTTSSKSVTPTASTTYTITCTSADGTTGSDTAIVNVSPINQNPTAPTVSLLVNSSHSLVTLNQGQSYSATWTTTGVTTCNLTSPLQSGVPTSSTFGPVTPTTFTNGAYYPTTGNPVMVSVTCSNGTQTASDSVTVSGSGSNPNIPTVSILVNGSHSPAALTPGQSYTATWTSTNATSCTQTAPVQSGVNTFGSFGPVFANTFGGGQYYYPTTGNPVTVSVTCSNGTQTGSDSVTVTAVNSNPSAPVVTLTASPTTISAGQSTTLTISGTNNPTSCTIDGTSVAGTGGTKTVSPMANTTTTYTGSCTNSAGTGSMIVTVMVSAVPVVTLTATPSTSNPGQSVNLGISATYNPTSCAINNFDVAPGGGIAVAPTTTTTYTGTCTNAFGTGTKSVTVTVTNNTLGSNVLNAFKNIWSFKW